MKKGMALLCAILWSISTMWESYRFFSNLPVILKQTKWEFSVDVIWIIGYYCLDICFWFLYIKARKQGKRDTEEIEKSDDSLLNPKIQQE